MKETSRTSTCFSTAKQILLCHAVKGSQPTNKNLEKKPATLNLTETWQKVFYWHLSVVSGRDALIQLGIQTGQWFEAHNKLIKSFPATLTEDVGGHKHASEHDTLTEAQHQKHQSAAGQTHGHPKQAGQGDGEEETPATTQPENKSNKNKQINLKTYDININLY